MFFRPLFDQIKWPADKEFDQKELNLFLLKRLDYFLCKELAHLDQHDLLAVRFKSFMPLKKLYPIVIEKVSEFFYFTAQRALHQSFNFIKLYSSIKNSMES